MDTNIAREIQKLDVQVTGMAAALKRIKDMLEQPEHEGAFDIEKTEKYGVQARFKRHVTGEFDKDLAYRYCAALASAAELANEKSKCERQYFYIFRIYHANYEELIFERLLRDARIFSADDWKILIDGIGEGKRVNLFFDLVLMLSMDSQIDEAQMEYLCEIMAFCECTREHMALVLELVKAIMKEDRDALYYVSKKTDINSFIPYLGKKEDSYVLGSISQIHSCSRDNVMVFGETIENEIHVLHIEKKKKVVFYKCCFKNIAGVMSDTTEVVFEDCSFIGCRRENYSSSSWERYKKPTQKAYLLQMNKATLINTQFEDCAVEGYENGSSLFKLSNSKIVSCQFKNCSLGIKDGLLGKCIFLDGEHVWIEKNMFVNCSIFAEVDQSWPSNDLAFIRDVCGTIIGNTFENCICDGNRVYCADNFMLVYDDDTVENDNVFRNCQLNQKQTGDRKDYGMKIHGDRSDVMGWSWYKLR